MEKKQMNYYNVLSSQKSPEEKERALSELMKLFRTDRILLCHFFNHCPSSFFTLLCDLYIKEAKTQKFSNLIMQCFDYVSGVIPFQKDIYYHIYQSLSLLYFDQSKITEKLIEKYLILLKHLYQNSCKKTIKNKNEKNHIRQPKNFFYFLKNSKLHFSFNVNKTLNFTTEGITFIFWFRMNNLLDNSFSNCVLLSITSSSSKEKNFSFIISLNHNYQIIVSQDGKVKAENNNNIIKLKNNEYYCLSIAITTQYMTIWTSSDIDNEYHFNLQHPNVKIEPYDTADLFDNCTCEMSSVVILKKYMTKKDLILRSLVDDFPFGLTKLKKIEPFARIIPFDIINSIIISTPDENPDEVNVVDLYGNIKASLIGECQKINFFYIGKNINDIGGVKNILPIIEMIYTAYVHQIIKITEEILFLIFDLIEIIMEQRGNIDDLNNSHFFPIISLFLEKFPKEIFTPKIFTKIYNLGNSIKKERISFYHIILKNILLNEKIFNKFPTQAQETLWESLEFLEPEEILSFLSINKMCLLLKYYDERRYFEYCCEEHKNAFINGINTRVMTPNFNDKTKKFISVIQTIINKMDMSKTSEHFVLFKLLSLELSPCLSKIIIKIFINCYQNKDLYLKYRANQNIERFEELFENIIINLLSHSLPDVKINILQLISVTKSKKKLSNEFIDGIRDNISLSDAFYTYPTYKATDAIINQLAEHCSDSIKMNEIDKNICTHYNQGMRVLILKDEYYKKNNKLIFNLILSLLLNKQIDNYETYSEFQIKETDEIQNEKVIEILINFVEKVKDNELNIILSKHLLTLFKTNYANCYILYSNKYLYQWNLKMMFKEFIAQKTEEDLYENTNEVLFKIFENTIKQDYKMKKILQAYPVMALNNLFIWFQEIKSSHNEDKLIEFIDYVFSQYTETIIRNLKNDYTLSSNIFENLMTIFSMIIEFNSILSGNINEYLGLSKSENISESVSNMFIKGKRGEYVIKTLDSIYKIFSPIFSFEKIEKKCNVELDDALIKRAEIIIRSLIYNKVNKNLFEKDFITLNYVFSKKFNWKLSTCMLIYHTLAIETHRKDESENEIIQLLKDFKEFIYFYVIGSCNLWEWTNKDSINIIPQIYSDAGNIVYYAIFFMYEKYKQEDTSEIVKSMIINCIRELMSFLIILVDQINESIENSKGFSMKYLFSQSEYRKELLDNGVFTLFTNDPPILTSMSISEFKSQSFENIPNCFEDEPWKTSFFNNKNLYSNLLDYFMVSQYKEKMKARKNEYSIGYIPLIKKPTIKISPLNRSDKIIQIIKEYQIELAKFSSSSFVAVKEKRNAYKRIKKEIFLWKGMWSNYDDLYKNKLKLKVLNHYTKFLARPILIPILDIDYYVPNFTNFQIKRMFKEKSIHKINLDIDELLKSNEQMEESQYSSKEQNINDMNYLNEIDFQTDKVLCAYNNDFIKKVFLSGEDDFMKFYREMRTLSKDESLLKHENYYPSCFVKPSHHIKGVFFIDSEAIKFRVFINQIKGNNIVTVEEHVEDKIKEKTDCGFDKERNTCFGSYFVYHHKDKDALTFTVKYDEIKKMFRRRYYQRNTGIEFFSNRYKSYLFIFKTEDDREKAMDDIKEHMSEIWDAKAIKIDLQKNTDAFKNTIGYKFNKKEFLSIRNTNKLSDIIKKWLSLRISNFEFLMRLNILSNRSFSDLSQYPVFPWIIKNYDSQTISLDKDMRELNIPMGMMKLNDSGISRSNDYSINYETLIENQKEVEDSTKAETPYYFGSHYSNPIYTVHYLTRLFPYSAISIELQGDKFDNSDRLFLSIGNSFFQASSSKGDVREIIPEFFYLPEMLININNLNLGETQEAILVDNVRCPTWSDKDPYKFISLYRKYLESDEISQKINMWIDLIFGAKSKGKEAVEALNLFFSESYEVEIDKMKVFDEKVLKMRMVEFGVTPKQISSTEFPVKKKECVNRLLIDGNLNWKCLPLRVNNCNWATNKNYIKFRNLMGFKVIEGIEKMVALYREENEIQLFKFPNIDMTSDDFIPKYGNPRDPSISEKINLRSNKSILEEKNIQVLNATLNSIKDIRTNKKYHYLGTQRQYYDLETNTKNPPILYIQNYTSSFITIIQGGFIHSKLLFTSIDYSSSFTSILTLNEYSQKNTQTKQTINTPKTYKTIFVLHEPFSFTALCKYVNEIKTRDECIIAGNSIGNLFILNITGLPSEPSLTIVKTIINNTLPITDIFYSQDLNVFCSASTDGYINLYTVPLLKLFRSIYIPNRSCDFIFLASCPLPCVIIFSENEKEIAVYSINGQYITAINEPNGFKSVKLVKDSNFCECVLYISARKIIARNLPYLEVRTEISVTIRDAEILDINEEMKFLYIGNMQGNEWAYIKNKELS